MNLQEVQDRELVKLRDRWNDLLGEVEKLTEPAVKVRFTELTQAVGRLLADHVTREESLRELARMEGKVLGMKEVLADARANEQYLLDQVKVARAAATPEG